MNRSKRITIALDALGGDHGVSVVVPAAIRFLKGNPDVEIILVGREDAISEHMTTQPKSDRLRIHHASQEVGMDEPPSRALRGKKDSSMRVALNLVKDGVADACVSAGNTGALMATARFVLKMLPHVDRPAIITAIPSIEGRTWVLDLGANVDCSSQHLFQFAVMGSEMVAAVDENIASPKIGLLNIGEEEIKGNEQVKNAHRLLTNSTLNYIGYVEGDGIYKGNADVVVTDGFVGNVALKSSEGVAKMIAYFLKAEFKRNLYTRIVGMLAMPVLRNFRHKADPRSHNGASLLGLRGVVIKSHGGADVLAFENAINVAKQAVRSNVSERIATGVAVHLDEGAGE